MDNINDLIGKVEPLHEDLVPYLDDSHPSIGQTLRHPLVYSVPHVPQLNAVVNASYKLKKERADEFLKSGQFDKYVFIHERPYRLDALDEVRADLNDQMYWQLVGEVWTDSENINQNLELWRELWDSGRPFRSENVMDDNERKFLESLPEMVTIYRGFAGSEDYANGLSWSLDKNKAIWFAKRFQGSKGRLPMVATAVIDKKLILAYLNGRNEQEIVVDPETFDQDYTIEYFGGDVYV